MLIIIGFRMNHKLKKNHLGIIGNRTIKVNDEIHKYKNILKKTNSFFIVEYAVLFILKLNGQLKETERHHRIQ